MPDKPVMEVSDIWKIRPKDVRWSAYRLIDAEDEPEKVGDFINWPLSDMGEYEYIEIKYNQVIELKDAKEHFALYAFDGEGIPSREISCDFTDRGKYSIYKIVVKGMSVHRRRLWLEDNQGSRYFLGNITSECIFRTENISKYMLKYDSVCKALLLAR